VTPSGGEAKYLSDCPRILVSESDTNYHYRAFLQTILNYGSDGKVNGDIFNQTKLLFYIVDLRISFNMEKTLFYLMETGSESNLKIFEAQLVMNHITVSPSILLAHHHVIQTKNALYPFSNVEISFKMFCLPANITQTQTL